MEENVFTELINELLSETNPNNLFIIKGKIEILKDFLEDCGIEVINIEIST